MPKKIINGKLGDSITGKKKGAKLKPIRIFLIKGKTNKKALIIAGVHGSEVQGIEVAKRLINDLQNQQPKYTVVIVPSLFPHHEAARKREGKIKTNRDFPSGGTSDLTQVKAMENKLLIQLIDRFGPTRIISIHGTHQKKGGGVFSDPIYISKQRESFIIQRSIGVALGKALLNPKNFVAEYISTFSSTYKRLMASENKEANMQTEKDRNLSLATAQAINKKIEDQSKLAVWANNLLPSLKFPNYIKELGRRKGLSKTQKQTPASSGNDIKNPTFLSHIWMADRKDVAWKNTHLAIKSQNSILKKFDDKTKIDLMNDLMNGKLSKKYDPTLVKAMRKIKNEYKKSVEKLKNTNKNKTKKDNISLGNYAPGKGISTFTIEPSINQETDDYPSKKDPGVSKNSRSIELQSYADAIKEVLLN